jgi:hypothetical protein
MIDEIILELEKAYPSNSYENIIADQVQFYKHKKIIRFQVKTKDPH